MYRAAESLEETGRPREAQIEKRDWILTDRDNERDREKQRKTEKERERSGQTNH